MILIEVKHIHKRGDLWVVPYVRKTKTKTIGNKFEFHFYQQAKRKHRELERLIKENNGLYIAKKDRVK